MRRRHAQKPNSMMRRTQHFGENEDQNHADEEPRLLRRTTHAGITDDADGEPGRQPSQADRQTGAELDEAGIQRDLLLQVVGDEHCHDETVNGNDTSHDDGDDV